MNVKRRAAILAVVLMAGSGSLTTGCNTFASTPEFEASDSEDSTADAADTTADVPDAEDTTGDTGEVDTSDVGDAADSTDTADGGDADEDVIEPSPGSWSVPGLASGSFLPTISITGTYRTPSVAPEFGVAFVSMAADVDGRGSARFYGISLPDLGTTDHSGSEFVDAEWDVATGLDEFGRLVFGAVQPCQDDVVARVVHRPDIALTQVPISTPCQNSGPDPRNMSITGGFERFNSATGGEPNYVWSEGGGEQILSTISEDFTPASQASDDQMIARFATPMLDESFTRASGGNLVLFRDVGGNALVWDASRRDADGPAPTLLPRAIENGGELVFIDGQSYLLIRAPEDVLTVEAMMCDANRPLGCRGFIELGAYTEPSITAFRAAAFPGGFVIGSLADNLDGQQLVFRVFDVSVGGSVPQLTVREVRSQNVTGVDPAAFDVGATLVDGDLFVAAAYVRTEQAQSFVDVRGHKFVDHAAQ